MSSRDKYPIIDHRVGYEILPMDWDAFEDWLFKHSMSPMMPVTEEKFLRLWAHFCEEDSQPEKELSLPGCAKVFIGAVVIALLFACTIVVTIMITG